MALKKLSEDARRAQDRELIRQQARKARDAIDIKLKKLKDTKEYQLKNENEQKKLQNDVRSIYPKNALKLIIIILSFHSMFCFAFLCKSYQLIVFIFEIIYSLYLFILGKKKSIANKTSRNGSKTIGRTFKKNGTCKIGCCKFKNGR